MQRVACREVVRTEVRQEEEALGVAAALAAEEAAEAAEGEEGEEGEEAVAVVTMCAMMAAVPRRVLKCHFHGRALPRAHTRA